MEEHVVLLKISYQNEQCVSIVLDRTTELPVRESSGIFDFGTYCKNLRSNFYHRLGLTVMNLDLIQPIFGSCDT